MKTLLTTASFILLSNAALAGNMDTWPRWYIGLSGGVTYLDDSDVSGTSTGELGYDTGFAVTGSVGYILADELRLEFETGYHEASLDNTTLSGVSTASPGTTRIASYMVNAFYDMRTGSRLTPYIGGGAGIAQVSLSKNSGLGNTADGNDNVLAYQGMAGISYAPESMPSTEWSLGYRYFVAHDPEFNTATGRVKLDNIAAHTAEIGGRFKF